MAFEMNPPSMINISYKNQSSGISPLRQVESSPADKKPPTDWKNDKQSLLNQYRKFRVKASNRIIGGINKLTKPLKDISNAVKNTKKQREHSDGFSRNVH